MDCNGARATLHTYLDGELDAGECARLEAHLDRCTVCAAALTDFQKLGEVVRAGVTRYRASAGLAARIGAALPDDDPQTALSPLPAPRVARRWLPLAASVLLTAVLSSGITVLLDQRGAERRSDAEVIAAHVRSLMADHLTDVASSDQHTVRPWFSGRIDVAPPVRDLAADGFSLVGGRLDYLDGRATAALVYRHDPHLINVFIRPATDTATTAPALHNRQGYLIAQWSAGGLAYTAVSDLSRAEMEKLAGLLATAPSPPQG